MAKRVMHQAEYHKTIAMELCASINHKISINNPLNKQLNTEIPNLTRNDCAKLLY
jgi:hypothetical protein